MSDIGDKTSDNSKQIVPAENMAPPAENLLPFHHSQDISLDVNAPNLRSRVDSPPQASSLPDLTIVSQPKTPATPAVDVAQNEQKLVNSAYPASNVGDKMFGFGYLLSTTSKNAVKLVNAGTEVGATLKTSTYNPLRTSELPANVLLAAALVYDIRHTWEADSGKAKAYYAAASATDVAALTGSMMMLDLPLLKPGLAVRNIGVLARGVLVGATWSANYSASKDD